MEKGLFFFLRKHLVLGNKLVMCNVDEEERFLKVFQNELRPHCIDNLNMRTEFIPF